MDLPFQFSNILMTISWLISFCFIGPLQSFSSLSDCLFFWASVALGALQHFLYFKPIFLILLDTVDWLIFKQLVIFHWETPVLLLTSFLIFSLLQKLPLFEKLKGKVHMANENGLTSLLKIWNELLTLIYSRTSQKIE